MITRRQFDATASAALLVPSVSTIGARAAAWPTRAVRIIVPFAAGGPTDVIGRIVGEQLSKGWGQQVVIENRPGGGYRAGFYAILQTLFHSFCCKSRDTRRGPSRTHFAAPTRPR
jgi:tripartite-type tricarboxylate transporter receptor subunit TctC